MSTSPTIVILDPTSKANVVEVEMALRVDTLNGKRVGFLWNAKPNADHLLQRLEELLQQRFEFASVLRRKKRISSEPAYESIIEDLARECDLVVNAVGD